MKWKRLSEDAVAGLLDFSGGRAGDPVWADIAQRQLRGTVALFNRLVDRRIAWLADEVGMGKTYVALGVYALVRHLDPGARVLLMVPSARLQPKWLKELQVLRHKVVRIVDGRIRTDRNGMARRLTTTRRLQDLARLSILDPDQDVLASMSAFSFGLRDEPADWRRTWQDLRREAPSLPGPPEDVIRSGDKESFKRHYAAAMNLILPRYDLVIVDESHNLKRGPAAGAARNRTLAAALGGSAEGLPAGAYPGLAPKVGRLLCLSATPVETDYEQLVAQARVFGLGGVEGFRRLADAEVPTEDRKQVARRFVVRRLNRMMVGERPLTKNLYRREWRSGGLTAHDAPLDVTSARERLVLALVQKKVAELLHAPRDGGGFLPSFQMGMLSSFESFFETIRRRTSPPDAEGNAHDSNFDAPEQTLDERERRGVDTATLNDLARTWRERFGIGLPHPKLDRSAEAIGDWMAGGEKTLVFVRRVRTVEELAAKIAARYDRDLFERLRAELPAAVLRRFEGVVDGYQRMRRSGEVDRGLAEDGTDDDDTGSSDTFFAWYFRGDGKDAARTGAWFRKNQLQSPARRWSVLFHDNHVLALLGDADRVREWIRANRVRLEAGARKRFHGHQTTAWRNRFEAWQGAALELLEAEGPAEVRAEAAFLRRQLYARRDPKPVLGEIGDPELHLTEETLFTVLRGTPIGAELWPRREDGQFDARVREREIRRELLGSMVRLGHPTIDLWLSAVELTENLEGSPGREDLGPGALARAFVDRLVRQRDAGNRLSSWRELAEAARHHALLVETNFPDVEGRDLDQLPVYFQGRLARQSPVLGMHGGSRSQQALVQFRMPGYPLAIVSTDILQEGVDLHTFCGRVLHYGVAYTSSATEQRTGRIDRIGCLAQRRVAERPDPDSKLQVHYPHLLDTMEPVQMEVLYRRMDLFLRLLHAGLESAGAERSWVSLEDAVHKDLRYPQPVETPLESAFEVADEDLVGGTLDLRADASAWTPSDLATWAAALASSFELDIYEARRPGEVLGEALLVGDELLARGGDRELARRQPFRAWLEPRLDGRGQRMRVVSPVGRVSLTDGRTAGKVLRLQEGLVGCAFFETGPHHGTLAVRSDVPLEAGCVPRDRLRLALDAALGGADLAERELMGAEVDADLESLRGTWDDEVTDEPG